jgi:hypothetical protein
MSRFLRSVLESVKDPEFWKRRISRRPGILPVYYRLTSPSGVDVMDENWDNLIILDACRFDLYKTHAASRFEGELESRRSHASTTESFLRYNFEDETYHDTVYVTANPQVNIRIDANGIFHDVISVWETDWDGDKGTVRPEAMANRVIEVANEYPNKRLIAHFVQPHYPFLGETARQFEEPGINGEELDELVGQQARRDRTDIWAQLEKGQVEKNAVWKAYAETLEAALPSVERVVSDISGRTIITADHGNMVGERAGLVKIYGHPGNILTEELTRVPWHPIPGERKEIVSEPPQGGNQTTNQEVTDHLAALGYVD